MKSIQDTPPENKTCELLRKIRKQLCENNGIPFLEEGCPTPNKKCIGTCPECDHWLERLNYHLMMKKANGEIIKYDGIEVLYQAYSESLKNRQP